MKKVICFLRIALVLTLFTAGCVFIKEDAQAAEAKDAIASEELNGKSSTCEVIFVDLYLSTYSIDAPYPNQTVQLTARAVARDSQGQTVSNADYYLYASQNVGIQIQKGGNGYFYITIDSTVVTARDNDTQFNVSFEVHAYAGSSSAYQVAGLTINKEISRCSFIQLAFSTPSGENGVMLTQASESILYTIKAYSQYGCIMTPSNNASYSLNGFPTGVSYTSWMNGSVCMGTITFEFADVVTGTYPITAVLNDNGNVVTDTVNFELNKKLIPTIVEFNFIDCTLIEAPLEGDVVILRARYMIYDQFGNEALGVFKLGMSLESGMCVNYDGDGNCTYFIMPQISGGKHTIYFSAKNAYDDRAVDSDSFYVIKYASEPTTVKLNLTQTSLKGSSLTIVDAVLEVKDQYGAIMNKGLTYSIKSIGGVRGLNFTQTGNGTFRAVVNNSTVNGRYIIVASATKGMKTARTQEILTIRATGLKVRP